MAIESTLNSQRKYLRWHLKVLAMVNASTCVFATTFDKKRNPLHIERVPLYRVVMRVISSRLFLLEVSLVETSEACCMTSLVLSHLVNSVMDSIRALLLSQLSNAELVLTSTLLGSNASLEVALGVT